jgi:hypothetical protein
MLQPWAEISERLRRYSDRLYLNIRHKGTHQRHSDVPLALLCAPNQELNHEALATKE